MLMRFRLARTITVAGFTDDTAPSASSDSHISLGDWVADKSVNKATTGHALRVMFVDAGGAEVVGGSVDFQVWGLTTGGFWVADVAVTGASGTSRYVSDLTGDLFVQVTGITAPVGGLSLQLLVQEI